MKRGVLIGIFRRMLFVAAAAVMTAVVVLCGGCSKETPLRVLYWNIQNGMWADQGNNYDNFVEWVKRYDPDGNATLRAPYNPNGSSFGIEGIISRDGHILGKMGHTERYEDGLFKNIAGNKVQEIFANAVNYFKGK